MQVVTNNHFQRNLAFGKIAETTIALWLRRRCKYTVLPIYDNEYDTGKGPRIFEPNRETVGTDLFIWRDDIQGRWIEAKHKTVFTWYWSGSKGRRAWTTGIDLHHYEEYLRVNKQTPWRVWLLFLHESAKPQQRDIDKGCPIKCPTGLFGRELDYLREHEHHRDLRWGRHGMVYWTHEDLILLASMNAL